MVTAYIKGYEIKVESHKTDSGKWVSDAQIKYGSDSISLRVVPYGEDGYDSQQEAERKVRDEAQAWLERKTFKW